MNAFSISSKPFITKFQENTQRVDKRVNDYLADSNEGNIHNINEDDIPDRKLQQRFNKVVSRFGDRIELNFPVVISNINKTRQLHEMRKDCKKLRYLLELLPNQNKEISKTITELEEIQDMLGSIHDDDIVIA